LANNSMAAPAKAPATVDTVSNVPGADLVVTNVLLKDLMTSNNVVTNTIGTILVKISPTLWVGKYEVTQKEYTALGGGNPSAFPGDNKPVDSVTWNEAMNFCQKLTDKEREQLPAGFGYAIPTENQWQALAANLPLSDAVMKINGDRSSTESVGSLAPSSQGLYDLRGNVMEWCLDSADPNSFRVLRGGSWNTWIEPSTRVEFRNYAPADEKKNEYGFRLVLESGSSQ